VLVVALCVLAPATAWSAPSNGTTGRWTVVGGHTVSAMARSGDVVYFGGSFTGIARRTPSIAAFDTTSGAVSSNLPDLDGGSATVVAAAPDGGVYVAGSFTSVRGQPRMKLLHFGPDDTLDPEFKPKFGSEATIHDIAVGADGTVYVAGFFTSVAGLSRTSLVALDGTTGAVKSWHPALSANAEVRHIELGPGGAFIAGGFTTVGGQARRGLAQVSLTTGSPTAWDPQPTGSVDALAVAGTTVFLGGSFTAIDGVPRSNLAAVATGGSGSLLSAWNPAPDSSVSALEAHGSTLYVGGAFSNIGGQARNHGAALNATSGSVTAWDAELLGGDSAPAPTAILATDDRVYLGFSPTPGSTVNVAGQSRCGLAAVDVATGQVATGWDPEVSDIDARCGGTGGVTSLASSGGRLWAAGDFQTANVQPRTGLAAIDVATDTLTAWAPKPDLPNPSGLSGVKALAVSPDGSTVYLGGQFSTINGVTRVNAAAVSATGGADTAAAVTAWNPTPNGPIATVALSPSGQRVYLGGTFTKLGTASRARLGWVSPWNAATNPGAASAWTPSPDAAVEDIEVAPDGSVFVAGGFDQIGQATPAVRHGVAKVAADTGEAMAWDAGTPDGTTIDSAALAGGLLYVGGALSGSVGGVDRSNVAAFDESTGAVGPWNPTPNGRVRRVSVGPDGTVYLLGSFTNLGAAPVQRTFAAAVSPDGAVTGWNPGRLSVGSTPPPVQFVGDRVVIGGDFTSAGSRIQAGFGIFGPATAPTPATPPTLSSTGSLPINTTLTCQPGTFDGSWPFALTYEWLRDGAVITGASSTTYMTTAEDAEHDLRCRETAANAAGVASQESTTVASVVKSAPAVVVPPTVGGEPWVGGLARCSTGIWANGPTGYSYRWFMDGAAVAGATTDTYALGATDLGRSIACEVTASNSAGQTTAASAAKVVGLAPPRNLSSPLVSGDARVGSTVGCDPGTWTGASGFTYSWLRDGTVIPGESDTHLTLTSRDLGRLVACRVSATGPGGTALADSAGVRVQSLPHSTGHRQSDGSGASSTPTKLDLRSVRVQRDGTLLLKVAVPGAGTVSVEAAASVRSRSSAAARLVVGRTRAKPRGARVVTLHLKPTKRARRAIRRAGRRGLKVRFTVSFKPRGGGRKRVDHATLRLRSPARASMAMFTIPSPLGH
jgi:hypothetical protein